MALLFGVFGGTPDEDPQPAVQNVLLLIKSIVVVAAAIALITGAITGQTTAIIGGCSLFVLDFVLLSIWYTNFLVAPEDLPIDHGTSTPTSPGIALTAWVVWVALPVVTTLLAAARGRRSVSA
ncbi:hypothetical protein [Nocardia sp. NPDC050406]|uniref:hypothetical protein n=1 Tax=Nocardia sp. NPDC050406 TaxID=3364318 RepID=UPI0037BD86B6